MRLGRALYKGVKKNRVLIIDDDPNVTRSTRTFLEKIGCFEVREENFAQMAHRTARDFLPEIILLDLDMPDMDGSEVANQFGMDPILSDVPILLFTGQIPPQEVERLDGEWGGMRFVAKPMRPRALYETMKDVLAQRAN